MYGISCSYDLGSTFRAVYSDPYEEGPLPEKSPDAMPPEATTDLGQ